MEVEWEKPPRGEPSRPSKRSRAITRKRSWPGAGASYADHARGKLIMACGTGKTFSSLKIAEKLLTGENGKLAGVVLFIPYRIIRKPDRSASACPGGLKLRDNFRGECGNHRFAAVFLPDFLPDIRVA